MPRYKIVSSFLFSNSIIIIDLSFLRATWEISPAFLVAALHSLKSPPNMENDKNLIN